MNMKVFQKNENTQKYIHIQETEITNEWSGML